MSKRAHNNNKSLACKKQKSCLVLHGELVELVEKLDVMLGAVIEKLDALYPEGDTEDEEEATSEEDQDISDVELAQGTCPL